MVLPFAPQGNASDPCVGVEQYEASRPPVPEYLKQINLFFFIFNLILYAFTLIWLWKVRETPRFLKVRPFSLGCFLLFAFAVYNIPSYMAAIYPIPCALTVFCYIVALSWFGCLGITRGLALTVETLYANSAKKEVNVFAGEETTSQVTTTQSHASSVLSYTSKIFFLFKLAFGCVNIEESNISELVVTKNSYATMFIVASVPAWIVAIGEVAAVPAYQTCSNCEVFLELPIAFTALLTVYTLAAARAIMVALRVARDDSKGILKELLFCAFVVSPVAMIGWILILVDPGDLNLNRQLNWSLVFTVSGTLFWIVAFGYQFFVQWQESRRFTRIEIVDMKTLCKSDPGVKKEFIEFAAKHYVIESIQFLEDIETFKQFYYDKGDNWKASKFKSLVETYVLPGAKMEINIPHSIRSKIIRQYEQLKRQAGTNGVDFQEYYGAFDAAVTDVEQLVNNGAWLEFLIKRAKASHKSTSAAVVAVSE